MAKRITKHERMDYMNNLLFYGTANNMVVEHRERSKELNMKIRHFHAEYEIYYLVHGERYYFINNTTYPVRKGSLVFVNHNQIHKTGGPQNETSSHERVLFGLPSTVLQMIDTFIPGFSAKKFFSDNYGVLHLSETEQIQVEQIIASIRKEIGEKSLYYEQLAIMKVAELLLLADRKIKGTGMKSYPVPASTTKHEKVDQIAQYITKNYTESISLSLLEKECYVSKYYLCRIFKEITGLTVIEYTNLIRIQNAQKLLEKTDDSITEIAHKCGFDNIAYFQRVFKNYLLHTPLNYRKQVKKQLLDTNSIKENREPIMETPVI